MFTPLVPAMFRFRFRCCSQASLKNTPLHIWIMIWIHESMTLVGWTMLLWILMVGLRTSEWQFSVFNDVAKNSFVLGMFSDFRTSWDISWGAFKIMLAPGHENGRARTRGSKACQLKSDTMNVIKFVWLERTVTNNWQQAKHFLCIFWSNNHLWVSKRETLTTC